MLQHNKGITTLSALLIAGLVVATIAVGAYVYATLRVKGGGKVVTIGIGVFSDSSATIEVTTIDWGELHPGEGKQILLWLKLEGNKHANVSMRTENWNPTEAANFITLEWDSEGAEMDPGDIKQIAFVLRVSHSVVGIVDFSFDVVITAKELP